MTTIFLILGLIVLAVGAEMLVRGGSKLAAVMGISPLVIGLTIVAYGTSSPEMFVSIQAAVLQQADIAVGNIVGSNIFNVLFILGICALFAPLPVTKKLIKTDVPIMIGASLALFLVTLDGNISRWDGLLFLAGIVVYTFSAFFLSRRENKKIKAEYEKEFGLKKDNSLDLRNVLKYILLIVSGLVFLVVGARWLVDSAVVIAKQLGVSELIIGLTLVAAGTSLPELATSIVATLRKERDIAIGNVVGSNIFNILGILGVSSLVSKNGIPVSYGLIHFNIPVMVAVAAACLPIFLTRHLISRWEGALFLGCYIVYIIYLVR